MFASGQVKRSHDESELFNNRLYSQQQQEMLTNNVEKDNLEKRVPRKEFI